MSSTELPSLAKRVGQISCAITWCLLAAGPVFGFAALKPILIKEGVYAEKCTSKADLVVTLGNSTLVNSLLSLTNIEKNSSPCAEQDLSLNFMFTLAAVVTNIAALPVGSILDEYGPRVSGIIGSGLILVATLLLKFGKPLSNYFDAYSIGYATLALGGPFVFISSFQLANSFPKNSGLILALLTGAFDSSSALFLVYRLIYTNIHKVTLDHFFTYYLAVPIFIFLCQIFVMPRDSYKTMGTLAKIGEMAIDETGRPLNPDNLYPEDRDPNSAPGSGAVTPSESTALLMRRASLSARRASTVSRASYTSRTSVKSVYEQDAEEELIENSGGVFGIMHGYTVVEQLKSPWFFLMTLFTTIQMLRINFFVATIKSQELYLYGGDEKLAVKINQFFDLALPLGGLASIPFIGVLLDNFTTLSVLIILLVVSIFIGVMGLLSFLPATYAGILLLVMYRPFYYTAVSDFCAKVFGFETFGTVYGAIICFSGVCNILQQFMDKATHELFHMNPTPINATLTILTAVFGFMLLGYVRSQELEIKRKNLELEAQEASIRNVPH
ncbi:protein Fmp42p [[Candida] railenensis]|uniref:Protein Fmp42p n=1 Tax=[Candida] railenensis TaxID=45579 RepID=A0A9P0QQV4_9ASCO|nr:protein Fmp42p [[Candida] railenensis]